MLNLDTHVLIHALAGSSTPRERRLLTNEVWSISGIVLWETAKLHQLGRIDLDPGDADFARVLGAIHVWPITLDVARQSVRLDFRSDPADELIAATSIVHAVPLLTRDARIRKSKTVPFA
jgi:PIN domain nuclease of toxin-antitoxin system